MKVKIENIVSSITLDQKIDLETLIATGGVEHIPNISHGTIYRIPRLRISFLIFNSGKIICTGARSIADIEMAIMDITDKFNELNLLIKSKPSFEVQNIVASADLELKINLELLATECENVEYEPGQFSGLIFRLTEPKTVVLIFNSGKIVITGAKNAEDVIKAAEKTKNMITEFDAVIG